MRQKSRRSCAMLSFCPKRKYGNEMRKFQMQDKLLKPNLAVVPRENITAKWSHDVRLRDHYNDEKQLSVIEWYVSSDHMILFTYVPFTGGGLE